MRRERWLVWRWVRRSRSRLWANDNVFGVELFAGGVWPRWWREVLELPADWSPADLCVCGGWRREKEWGKRRYERGTAVGESAGNPVDAGDAVAAVDRGGAQESLGGPGVRGAVVD